MKGLAASEIHVSGPNQDLHSGIYGGGVQNPIHALVRLLDSMRAPDGTITVDGFYDAVRPLDAAERAQIARIPKDDDRYQAAARRCTGCSASPAGPRASGSGRGRRSRSTASGAASRARAPRP